MPWKETQVMNLRMQFVLRKQSGERMTDLCREFGISRKTGYKFIGRFFEDQESGLIDRVRRPLRVPRRTTVQVEQEIEALKRVHPTWGAKKLLQFLQREQPEVKWPSRSTMHEVLSRRGLVDPRRKRARVAPYTQPLSHATNANRLWCVDFKGQFRLGDHSYCYPLTLTDSFSRYLLGCEALDDTSMQPVIEQFMRWFDRYGLPDGIRSDNGTPFASARSLLGLTRLSVLWWSLGIVHERITPGCPEQNGAHERMHLTLKQETTRPAGANALAQQERFDTFRDVFNMQRPHEGIEMKTPCELYEISPRKLNGTMMTYALHDDVRTVHADGTLSVGEGKRVFLASALCGMDIGMREVEHDVFLLSFASLQLGTLHYKSATFEPIDRSPTPTQASV